MNIFGLRSKLSKAAQTDSESNVTRTSELSPDHVVNHAEVSVTPPVFTPESNKTDWNKPKPLVNEVSVAPPFTSDLLPSSMYQFASCEAQRMDNAPTVFIGTSLIVSIGSLIGQSVDIQPKKLDIGWKVNPNLWGMVIGTPSMKKTPCLEVAISFLHEVQRELIDPMNVANAEYAGAQNKLIESQIAEMKTELDSLISEGCEKEAKSLTEKIANTKESRALKRSLVANDTTTQALQIKLVDNPNGILLSRDELTGWFYDLGKQGRESDRAMYLQAFNASKTPYEVERVGRENIVIPSMTVSILGGIQPSRLSEILEERSSGKGNDGLFERFQLSVFPEANQSYYTDIAPDLKHKEIVSDIFMKLAQIEPNEANTCKYDGEAQALWGSWSEESALLVGTMDESWQALKGKHPALLAKLSLIFHLVEEAENCQSEGFTFSKVIRKHHLERAIKWLTYLDLHMKKIIQFGQNEGKLTSAQTLLGKLKEFDQTFSNRDVSQKGWSNLTTNKQRDSAFEELTTAGYICSGTLNLVT
ncbi:DUF3987 domain-containing protein [Vibrio splendidus]|uniref:DUF3987 domain-containing protein n=2 Tax=Vibrio splendidus TaxID=29497 RepID=UPI0015E6690A|nr:DUF3987 domain-containing protein [Vibrio splendidus]